MTLFKHLGSVFGIFDFQNYNQFEDVSLKLFIGKIRPIEY